MTLLYQLELFLFRTWVRTTISRKAVAAGDRVNRQFVAERPDQLWVADFTYVSTWQGFSSMWRSSLMCLPDTSWWWRVSSSMETTFVLDALEQALWARRPSGTVHPVIKVLSMYRWPTHSGLRKPDYWHHRK